MKTNPKADGSPSRVPMMMNAFVWPGVGQVIQRRWIAASIYLAGFLISTVFFCVHAVRIMTAYYNLWLRFDSNQPVDPPSYRGLLAWLLMGILIYVAALVDSYIAYVHARTQWKLRGAGTLSPPAS
jgi:hypothetical protein